MARRIMASHTSRALLRHALRPSLSPIRVSSHRQEFADPACPDYWAGLGVSKARLLSTSINKLPPIADPDVLLALKELMVAHWNDIDEDTRDAVEAALTKKTDDWAGQEELMNAWRAAEAVEKFSGTLGTLRMALDDLTGTLGEKVRPLPQLLVDALDAALHRYKTYLGRFKEEEFYLKKKVELELGSLLVQIRQRCTGLGPEWANVSVLGTSGLAGSFIELQAH